MTAVTVPTRAQWVTKWIHNPTTDIAMALCWVPFAVIAAAMIDNTSFIQSLLGATLLLSFLHQPLTIALVFGDKSVFNQQRAIFIGSLILFPIGVLVLIKVSFVALALIAGAWNAVHTLRQRYGITQIYSRKVEQNLGRLENRMLFSWLALVTAVAGASPNTPQRLIDSGLGGRNREAVEILTSFAGPMRFLTAVFGVTTIVLTAKWIAAEIQSETRNTAKHVYVASTALLFVVLLINPVIGLIAYVGSHALEYFIIVHQHLGKRYNSAENDGGAPIGKAVRTPFGRIGFFVMYLALLMVGVRFLGNYGSQELYAAVILTLGGCHVFWDGFIWKLRQPSHQKTFDITHA